MATTVTQMPATRNIFTSAPITAIRRRRVAAYARVSTDSDEQETSYEAQIDHYTNYIKSRSDWEFVHMYSDRGQSGLSTDGRAGFKEMLADAMAGKFDLLITKSVSRFARNTVDSLTTIRLLKEHGVECYFEKEQIWTFDGKGELMISILSSIAQEESRSISQNVTWGQRKRFKDGKVTMPYKHFLGYEKGPDGKPMINEEQAKTVRLIYRLFLEGETPSGIAAILTKRGIPSPMGKRKWRDSTILSILTNEKYKGEAILQKTYCADFLTKRMVVNQGEVPKWYVQESHPAIVSIEDFDVVQIELARRKQMKQCYSSKGLFASKLICADCGGIYGSKVWHSTDKYRSVIWQCNRKYDRKGDRESCMESRMESRMGACMESSNESSIQSRCKGDMESRCKTPHLKEDAVCAMFVKACEHMVAHKSVILKRQEVVIRLLTDCIELDAAIVAEQSELEVVTKLIQDFIKELATRAIPKDEADARKNALQERFNKISEKLDNLKAEREERLARSNEIRRFVRTFRETAGENWNTDANWANANWEVSKWMFLLEKAAVQRNGAIDFTFKDGTEIRVGRR